MRIFLLVLNETIMKTKKHFFILWALSVGLFTALCGVAIDRHDKGLLFASGALAVLAVSSAPVIFEL